MRNLESWSHVSHTLDTAERVQHLCVNSVQSCALLVAGGVLLRVSLSDGAVESSPLREAVQDVAAMGFSSVLDAVCVATSSGDVVMLNGAGDVEAAGSVSRGVCCLAWSPDEELLLLVTGAESVLAMGPSLDPLWEVPLWEHTFGEKPLVTVGWGHSSTQFHGREGKVSALAPSEVAAVVVAAEAAVEIEETSVSWRGDGTLVAVSAVRPSDGMRLLRIFNREGILQATSEPTPGLEAALAWRPSGNLLASCQRLPHKHQVVFFEKNGLRHGEFLLSKGPCEGSVQWLGWSPCSEVLSIWLRTPLGDRLLLCSTGNGHWYVKQTLWFPTGGEHPLLCQWHPDVPLQMVMVVGEGGQESTRGLRVEVIGWRWAVAADGARVAVIDGDKILLSDFSRKVVPPPMCSLTLSLPAAALHVMFGPKEGTANADICVVLCTGQVAFASSLSGQGLSVSAVVGVEGVEGSLRALGQWLWLSPSLLLLAQNQGSERSALLQMDPSAARDPLRATHVEVCVGQLVSLVAVTNSNGAVLLQTSKGDLSVVRGVGSGLCDGQSNGQTNGLTSTCIQIPLGHVAECLAPLIALEVGNGVMTVGRGVRSGRLYVNGTEVMGGVSSMLALPPDLLLITTTSHQLLCLPLNIQGGCVALESAVAAARRVERGSSLVAACGSRVVMQMPRGNLETISPRALVLREALHDLHSKRFVEAFETLRRHRVDLNLLVDHCPSCFLRETEEFVRQVPSAWLQLLPAELKDEDVTMTAYANEYRQPGMRPPCSGDPPPWERTAEGKRRAVCGRLRTAMAAVGSEEEALGAALFLPSLSCLAACGALEEALLLVKEASAKGQTLDEGLSLLLSLSSAHGLFDAALALHDFHLAALVAQRANRDPKEFIPFLNALRSEEEPFRSYRVEAHLGHWRKALAHLAHCEGRFDLFLSLVKEKGLFSHALSLLQEQSTQWQQVAAAFGEVLSRERRMEEAAQMLWRGGRPEEALAAARQAGDWPLALQLLEEMCLLPEEHMAQLAALASTLQQQRRFAEAARVLAESDSSSAPEEVVRVLCRGRLWAEARLAALRSRQREHLESEVAKEVLEHRERLVEEVQGLSGSFSAHLQRLRCVRQEKTERVEEEEAAQWGSGAADGDFCSDFSSSSGGPSTHSSSRSSRSGKSKRKQQKKLLSLKEGSAFEDVALLRAMHLEASSLFALRREVHGLCLALVAQRRDTAAAELQRLLGDALALVERSTPEVWPPALTNPGAMDHRFGPEATADSIVLNASRTHALVQNCELLEAQFRIPPQPQEVVNWKLSILTELTECNSS